MSNNKDPQNYLMAAGGLSIIAAVITYCAVNWDNPPEWWPNKLQPWWNKKEVHQKQTDKFLQHEDDNSHVENNTANGDDETKEPLVSNQESEKGMQKTDENMEETGEKNMQKTDENMEESDEVVNVTESLVSSNNIEIEMTKK